MRSLSKSLLGLWVIGMGLGVTAPAQAASGVGPYYAMPAWDQTLPAATRFIVLTNMNSEAVLDRETGLVWEQRPSSTAQTWSNANDQLGCANKVVGNRKGWRLPSIQELSSLVDPTNSNAITGPPFDNVLNGGYWSATTKASVSSAALNLFPFIGEVSFAPKTFTGLVWCVRGGQGVNPQ